MTKPILNTVLVGIEGDEFYENKHFTCDYSRGVVSFGEAPPEAARVTAGFDFDVPVRFDTDRLQLSVRSFAAGDIPNIPVIEVRV